MTVFVSPHRDRGLAALECLACGRSHSGGAGECCSARCRAWIAAGEPRYRPAVASYSLPIMGAGFAIKCKGCRTIFSSKGQRCCCAICEQNWRHHEDNFAVMAEVGIEPSARRVCEQCRGAIPRYRGVGKARREVRQDSRFCSRRCKQKNARMAATTGPGVLSPIEARKPLQNGALR